jgi:hypothetical protein
MVIDKNHAVTHKNFRFDGYAFAGKNVARHLAARANLRALLHFNQWTDLCFIADGRAMVAFPVRLSRRELLEKQSHGRLP